jgi:fructosamine-3-kinase
MTVDHWQAISIDICEATGQEEALGVEGAVSGGDINQAWRVKFGSRRFFVKLNDAARAHMFSAEALGLAELAASNTLKVPLPVCHGNNDRTSWLVLEYLQFRGHGDERAFGRELAAMHQVKRPRFGWDQDNTIGITPQHNDWQDDWITFWGEQRLGFQLDLAARKGHAGSLRSRGEKLLEALPALLGSHSPTPSLLHGDLWSGNHAFTAQGEPAIFDPAVYYGDRETDLAMTELFGGFGSEFYSAYYESYPLDAGYSVRKNLYNLYHVLNHLNLFGGHYSTRSEQMIDTLLAEAG